MAQIIGIAYSCRIDCFDDNIAVALFEGALPPQAEREVESHAAGCSACRRLLAELARSPSLAGRSPTIPAAGDAHIDLDPGDKVDRFSILGRIGHGGMGVVFSAYDPRLDRKVALKLLRSSDDSKLTPEEAQARLLREAQALAQQSHPNVIAVYDVGTYKSEVYIAMELVEGKTLGQWLRAYQRSQREILDKFQQAGRALAAAHGSGLVHRDFKPDNVLVGDDDRVRVMDFGLARSLFYDIPEESLDPNFRIAVDGVSELNRSLTATGAVLGTPRYMAPEQFLGRLADARSDQFSFCVGLWEALHGKHPFEGGTARALAESADTRPVAPAGSRMPAWVQRVLERGLAREPARRYPSMEALLRDLQPPRPSTRGRVLPVAALAVAVIVLGVYLYKSRREADDARNAIEEALRAAERKVAEAQVDQIELEGLRQEREKLVKLVESARGMTERVRLLEEEIVKREVRIAELEQKVQKRPGPRPPAPPPARGLSIEKVRSHVESRMRDIESCFREWRTRVAGDQIAVTVRFRIQGTGLVDQVTMGRTDGAPLDDRPLRECLHGALTAIHFTQAPDDTVVEYRFITSRSKFDRIPRVIRYSPARFSGDLDDQP